MLVSNTSYELAQIGQLYRDRADCENGFDEIKNQWGWGGYSTQPIFVTWHNNPFKSIAYAFSKGVMAQQVRVADRFRKGDCCAVR